MSLELPLAPILTLLEAKAGMEVMEHSEEEVKDHLVEEVLEAETQDHLVTELVVMEHFPEDHPLGHLRDPLEDHPRDLLACLKWAMMAERWAAADA